MNFFNQGLPLGRWFRIRVIIHWSFVLYAGFLLMNAKRPLEQGIYLGLLFGVVLMHEFGHALSCKAVGGQAPQIILWPLGGIAFVQPPMNPMAWLITTVCGPLVNAILWPTFWFLNNHVIVPHYENALHLTQMDVYLINACDFMEVINQRLLLFNLIPAYPMDGGRILQEVLWFITGYKRSLQIAGMVGVVAGGLFIFIGLGFGDITIPVIHLALGKNIFLAVIGFMCMAESWGIYVRSREIESWQKR